MKFSMKYFSILGIILFIFLLSRVDIKKTLNIILSANIFYIFLALLIFAISLFVRALKWHSIVTLFNDKYSKLQAFRTYVIGVAFGSVTPAKAGDLIKVLDLKYAISMPAKQSVSIIIFDKIIDAIILLIITFICIITISYKFSEIVDLRWLVLILIFIIVGLFFSLTKYSKYILSIFFRLVPERLKVKIKEFYSTFISVIATSRKDKRFIKYLFITVMSWAVIFIVPYFFIKAINLDVTMPQFILFIPVVYFVEALPISILGIGSRDATLILLFSLINISKEAMLSVSLLMLVITNLPVLALGFFWAWKERNKLYSMNIEKNE